MKMKIDEKDDGVVVVVIWYKSGNDEEGKISNKEI